jgi:hypothetical protein
MIGLLTILGWMTGFIVVGMTVACLIAGLYDKVRRTLRGINDQGWWHQKQQLQ